MKNKCMCSHCKHGGFTLKLFLPVLIHKCFHGETLETFLWRICKVVRTQRQVSLTTVILLLQSYDCFAAILIHRSFKRVDLEIIIII